MRADSDRVRLAQPDPGAADRQVARTRRHLVQRDNTACVQALSRLRDDTVSGCNVMPALVEAARAGATVGEMTGVFRAEFGEFREPAAW